jgi:hypothetical protein
MDYWRCVLERFLGAAILILAVAIIVAVVLCALGAAPTAELAFLPCLAALAPTLAPSVALSLALAFGAMMALCSGDRITPIDPTATSALTAEEGTSALPPDYGQGMDCQAAQAALAVALRELAAAREALDNAIAARRRAQRRLESALVAVGLSIGVVAGAVFRPDMLVAAIFASAAALALVARRSRALARAARRELAARAALAPIEARVAALKALVNALCAPRITPPVTGPGEESPGGGFPVVGTTPVTT